LPGVIVCVDEEEDNEKSCPIPLSATVCGLPLALSVIVSVPLLDPLPVGSKKTPIEQLEPAARLPPQALSTPKLAELVVTLAIVSGASPGFVTVTVCGSPEVSTYWPGNEMLDGDHVRAGAGVVTPVKLIICGLPGALSPMLKAAFRVPCAVGVKVTLTWHEALTARVAPQLLLSP
jgi:hypothetical protein